MAWDLKARWLSYTDLIELVLYSVWAFKVILLEAISQRDKYRLTSPSMLRDATFALWYKSLCDDFFQFEKDDKVVPKLVSSAYGRVLELGPATGNQLPRFDFSKIDHVYGIEINSSFVPDLKKKISDLNLNDKYTLITSGVEDSEFLEEHGICDGSFDCILSIQVLCSVSKPELVAKQLYRLLKPGGSLIFWEHHGSHDRLTWCVQRAWNLVWPYAVGGCMLDRNTKETLRRAGKWKNFDVAIEGDEEPWSMLPRIWGELVKAEVN